MIRVVYVRPMNRSHEVVATRRAILYRCSPTPSRNLVPPTHKLVIGVIGATHLYARNRCHPPSSRWRLGGVSLSRRVVCGDLNGQMRAALAQPLPPDARLLVIGPHRNSAASRWGVHVRVGRRRQQVLGAPSSRLMGGTDWCCSGRNRLNRVSE